MNGRLRTIRAWVSHQRDDGTTLSEILVVTVLLGVIGALVTSFVITTQREATGSQIRLSDLDQARVGMDAVIKTVRTAVEPAQLQLGCASCTGPASASTALTNATPTKVQLFANFGDTNGPVLVTFEVAYDNTREDRGADRDAAATGRGVRSQLHLHELREDKSVLPDH